MNSRKLNLYNQIASLLAKAQSNIARTVNQTMVYTYYEIGRMIVENEQKGAHRAEYGKQILKELSIQLTKNFGKGFSVENLDRMRYFYKIYAPQISSTVLTKFQIADNKSINPRFLSSNDAKNAKNKNSKSLIHKSLTPGFALSWSHYLKLMRIENPDERKFYEIECVSNNWSLRELQRQFDSALYERLVLSRNKKKVRDLSRRGLVIQQPQDTIKDPLVLEFLGLPELAIYSESDLEQQIINKLEHFLTELGKGFMFVGRQVRFTFEEKHFKVDLVFYNRILRCFVLIDLKMGELAHQDIGQLQMYVNYYDRFVKFDDENKTIGIILCKEKNNTLVEITLPENNTQIFASKYQTILPSKEALKQLIEDKKD